MDDLTVVAEQVWDNELSVDNVSRDQSRKVTPWQHKYTGENWIVGKHFVFLGSNNNKKKSNKGISHERGIKTE